MTDTATASATGAVSTDKPQPRLKQKYRAEITKQLTEEFGYTNPHQVPKIVKIVVNTGVGEAARDSKVIDGAIRDLTLITGQKPQVTKARKSIAQFKLRDGMPIGAHVTLRGDRAWEFMDRLVSLALPRIRVPRDQPGQDRPRPRIRHHRRHDREDRRRGPRPAARSRLPLPRRGRRSVTLHSARLGEPRSTGSAPVYRASKPVENRNQPS